MCKNASGTEERTELDDRDRRALEQYLTVLEDQGRVRGAEDLYLVVSESGSEYLVDTREGSCECADFEYRNIRCKHLRRVAFATGEEPIPAAADVEINPHLGEHVDASPRLAAADGGVILEADTDDVDPWSGPHTEYDKYGEPTGAKYYRCRDCGREVHEDVDRDHVEHRDGCRFGEDDRDAPRRSEPADFGGGESTGVQDL